MANSEQMKEMRLLITRELELNGFSIEKDPWLSSIPVLDEITHILIPEFHESKISSCGALFIEHPDRIEHARKLPLHDNQLHLARKLADGINSFLLYEEYRFSGLLFFSKPLISEMQMVHLLTQSKGLMVQRGATGVTRLFTQKSIFIHDNRVWFSKPHVDEAARRITMCVPGLDPIILNRILELAFHLISPASRTGATLVWYLSIPSEDNLVTLAPSQELRPLHLSIMDDHSSVAVCHFLSQIDGATVLDPQGRFICSGVHLTYSPRSSQLILEFKGSRHTSAQRFSYDHRNTLIIVVSEDGPVSVFSNGANIADLPRYSAGEIAELTKIVAPHEVEGIHHNSFELVCKRCDKTAMVEEVVIPECNEQQTVFCPVCLYPLYSANCFTLEVRSLNRLPFLTRGEINRKHTALSRDIPPGQLPTAHSDRTPANP